MAEIKKTSPVQSVVKKGMSTGTKVGIGIGAGCCLIVIIGLILGFVFGWNVNKVSKQQQARQQTYVTELRTINDDTAAAYNELNGINDKYPNFTDADLDTIDKDTVTIENAYDRLSKLDVPSDYQEINGLYKSGLQDFKEAMPIYRKAVRNKDNNELKKAVDLVNKGLEDIKKAKTKIEEKSK